MKEKNSFINETFITMATQTILIPISMIFGIILNRSIGPEGRGIYTLALLVPQTIVNFMAFGVSSSIVYFIGKKKYATDTLLSVVMFLALIQSLIGIISFTLLYPLISSSISSIPNPILLLVLCSTPLIFLQSYFSNALLALNYVSFYNKVRFIGTLFNVITLISAWFLNSATLFIVIGITIAGNALVCFVTLSKLRQNFKFAPLINWLIIKDLLQYGFRMYLNVMLASLNYRLDMFILGSMLTATDLGYYSTAVSWSEMLWLISTSVSLVFFPKIAALAGKDADNMSAWVCRTTLFLSFFMAIGMILITGFIIPLFYGMVFKTSILLAQLLIPGVWIMNIVKILTGDLAGRGKPELNIIPFALAVFANIPLNLFLVPWIGLIGAPISSTISYSVAALVTLLIFLRVSKNRWQDVLIIKMSDITFFKQWMSQKIKKLLFVHN